MHPGAASTGRRNLFRRKDALLSTPAKHLVSLTVPQPRGRLLIITYHYPPDGAVGGLRWAGLSKYLVRLGWEVHVLTTAAGPNDTAVAGLHRHHCPRRRVLNDVYASVATRVRRSAVNIGASKQPAAEAKAGQPGRLAMMVENLRMAGRLAIAFPDVGRGWILRAALTARKLLREQPFDAVISSGPPHSAHLAGLLTTLGSAVPHFVDMRDPWRGSPDFQLLGVKHRWMQAMVRPLERILFRRARAVVVTTREFAEELRRTEPRLEVCHVSNGTDIEGLPARTTDRFEELSIAYVGTLYCGRSFSTLIAALGGFAQDRPCDAARIKLRIAGSIPPADAEQLRAELATYGLTDMVELYGTIPRRDALELLNRSHLALVLAQRQPTQVPAKLYECIGLGVPTLVITETNSASAREARRIGGIVVESGDAVAMRRLLEDLVAGRLPDAIVPAAPISHGVLAREVDRILRPGPLRAV